jgi:uncharacterized protein
MANDMSYLDEVWQRLSTELPPELHYHSLQHTRDEVLPAAQQLAEMSGVRGEQKQLLLAAAAFHDTGFTNGPYEGHEERGIKIAETTLASHGYTPGQLRTVAGIIRATRWPQKPGSLVEEIMCDADLAMLGLPWEQFSARQQQLRAEEQALEGDTTTLEEFYERQIGFLSSHSYFTRAAHSLYDAQKAQNIRIMRERLEASRASQSP